MHGIKNHPLLAAGTLLALATLLALGGCRNVLQAPCDSCGVIDSIHPRTVAGEPTAAGTLAGAIIGGAIGHQFGSGRGRDAATVAGAVGGAFAGREVERRHRTHTVYDVTIRMDRNGGVRTLTVASIEGLRRGDKVQIADGRVIPAPA